MACCESLQTIALRIMNSPTFEILTDALHSHRCLLLVLSKPCGSTTLFGKVSIRPITLKHRELYQFTYQFPTKETHENLDAAPALTRIQELFPASFAHANLYTTDADYLMKSRKGEIHVVKRSASKTAEPREHNRSKHYLILPDVPCPFLAAIGVMTESGQVRAAKFHKFRQIIRFLELVEDILPELPR